MVAASKFFELPLKSFHCSQFPLHRGKTCLRSFMYDIYRFAISGLSYYSPLLLTPIAMKGTRITIANLIDTLKFYLETILASATTGSLIFFAICSCRNLFGEFKLWTTLWLGPYIAAQSCWLFPKRTLRIFFMATAQTALEALLRQYKCAFTYFLLNSKAMQTLIFMTSSTIIMHYKRLGLYNGFWFINPELLPAEISADNKNSNEIQKSEPIWKCLLKGCKTYFVYGLSLDILNMILKQYSSYKNKELSHVIWAAFKGFRLNMTCFFMSYAGFYKHYEIPLLLPNLVLLDCINYIEEEKHYGRLVLHYIPKYMTGLLSTETQHAIAAFLGGASYMFLNKLTYNTFALILAVQISWQDYCQKIDKNKEKNKYLEALKNISFARIMFPMNLAYIVFSFFYYNDSINFLGKNLIRATTDHKIQRIFDYLNKNELDFILRDCNLKPILGAF